MCFTSFHPRWSKVSRKSLNGRQHVHRRSSTSGQLFPHTLFLEKDGLSKVRVMVMHDRVASGLNAFRCDKTHDHSLFFRISEDTTLSEDSV